MFKWIQRLLRDSSLDQRRSFVQELDAIHADHHGGQPVIARHFLGALKLGSGTLVLGDPQNPPSVEIPNVPEAEVGVSARLWRYPSESQRVAALTVALGNQENVGLSRTIGAVPIDSAKLVVLDRRTDGRLQSKRPAPRTIALAIVRRRGYSKVPRELYLPSDP